MKHFLFLFFCFFSIQISNARYDAICYVQYETEEGWSEKITTEVSFVSGIELTPKQYSNEVYAIIWFSNSNCAIIKLRDNYISSDFKQKDFRSLYWINKYYNGKQVNSEYKRLWKITAKDDFNQFIDERVPEGIF